MSSPLVPFRHSPEPDEVGRLLAKGAKSMKTPQMSAEARAKILNSLPTQPAPAATLLPWMKVTAFVVGGLGILGIALAIRSRTATTPSSSDPHAVVVPAAQEATNETPSSVSTAAGETAPVISVSDLPMAAPAHREHSPAARPTASGEDVDTLPREVALIDRARASQDPNAKLAVFAEHARAFPNGKLALEREVFAVEALLQAGRNDEARSRGEALIRSQPSSPHAARVRKMLQL
ncbi:hypothetical protein AKJ09_04070 [Labilithrix luteola]|uniref:Tetratricopeptide repeat protein n=1 Tax=Labilithrix luteola TaxID=1391654 RepID=A0A0K1PVK6_9BACT|nr:hypothetical protein [Labilithrix luteola]AKU97406.1 hypothetical protein AKJ09_04070 [Labilithrix luteola]